MGTLARKNNVTTCISRSEGHKSVASQRSQQIRPQQRRTTARVPHRAAPPHRTSHKQARRKTMRVTHRQTTSPKMRFSHKLTTALALLALHGAAGDDLCAPASTSAARRVYAVARRAPLTASHAGHRHPRRRRTTRPRRRRPRRPCRAGAQTASKLNDSFKNPIWSKTEQVWSRQRCASAALRPTSGPDNATALGRGPCDARLARGLPRRAHHHMAAHEQQS